MPSWWVSHRVALWCLGGPVCHPLEGQAIHPCIGYEQAWMHPCVVPAWSYDLWELKYCVHVLTRSAGLHKWNAISISDAKVNIGVTFAVIEDFNGMCGSYLEWSINNKTVSFAVKKHLYFCVRDARACARALVGAFYVGVGVFVSVTCPWKIIFNRMWFWYVLIEIFKMAVVIPTAWSRGTLSVWVSCVSLMHCNQTSVCKLAVCDWSTVVISLGPGCVFMTCDAYVCERTYEVVVCMYACVRVYMCVRCQEYGEVGSTLFSVATQPKHAVLPKARQVAFARQSPPNKGSTSLTLRVSGFCVCLLPLPFSSFQACGGGMAEKKLNGWNPVALCAVVWKQIWFNRERWWDGRLKLWRVASIRPMWPLPSRLENSDLFPNK